MGRGSGRRGLLGSRAELGRLGVKVFSASLFGLYVVLIAAHRGMPSLGDYGDLTYQGVLLGRHMRGLLDAAHAVKRYPVPNGAVTVGIGLLSMVLPWAGAAKLWLCGQIGLSGWALWRFDRVRPMAGAMWVIAPGALFLNLNFFYGFLNFELGICWLVLLLAELLGGARRTWVCGVLLLLGFFSHSIAFLMMALLFVVYAVESRRWRMLRQMVLPGLVSVWYVVGRFGMAGNADGAAGMVSAVRWGSAAFWAFKANSFLKSFGWVNLGTRAGSATLGMFGEVGFVGLFAVNAVLCGCLLVGLVRGARGGLRRGSGVRFLFVGALIALPVYLLAPGAALGISDPGARVLEVAAVGCLLVCGRTGCLRWAAGCSAVLAAAGVVMFAWAGYRVVTVRAGALPRSVVEFAHVPNHDKDEYVEALGRGDFGLGVFPTGLLLNGPEARPPSSREQ